MTPAIIPTALSLLFFLRRKQKGKETPVPPQDPSLFSNPAVIEAISERQADNALDIQIWAMYGLDGAETDQVRLSDILSVLEAVTLGQVLAGTCDGRSFTDWEAPSAPSLEASIEVVEEAGCLVARTAVGTDDWARVRWVVRDGALHLEVVIGEVVDTSPIPLGAPRESTARMAHALPAPVDASRATVDLSDGVLTVRLPRA